MLEKLLLNRQQKLSNAYIERVLVLLVIIGLGSK